MNVSRLATICVLAVAGAAAVAAGPAAAVNLGSGIRVTSNSDPDWSADGRKIAFTRYWQGKYEIWVMNANGTHARRVSPVGVNAADPSWSPDGSQLAFTYATRTDAEVYTIRVDGTHLQGLTSSTAIDDSADWSPDGRQIVFRSWRDGKSQLYMMNADGTAQHRVLVEEGWTPSWSPDGTRIAFEGGSVDSFIDVVNVDGTGLRRLTTSGAENEPAWSPDGTRIAFSEYSCGCNSGALEDGIWSVPIAGGVPKLLVDGSDTFADSPAWSPDGTRLGYVGDFLGHSQVYVRAVLGGVPVRLTGVRPLKTSTHDDCTIVGSPGPDLIVGTEKADVICGLGGDDTIRGLAGGDTLDGGPGADTLDGGADADLLLGGPGADLLLARDGTRDRVDGGAGNDRARTDPGDWISFLEDVL